MEIPTFSFTADSYQALVDLELFKAMIKVICVRFV